MDEPATLPELPEDREITFSELVEDNTQMSLSCGEIRAEYLLLQEEVRRQYVPEPEIR
jgi:hypothetical protein